MSVPVLQRTDLLVASSTHLSLQPQKSGFQGKCLAGGAVASDWCFFHGSQSPS